jgi:hypothetical protein
MGGKRKFAGGEGFKVRHADHNAWQDAGDHHGATFGGSAGSLEMPDEQTGVILVKNITGRDLPRYSILTLYGSIYDPTFGSHLQDFKNQIALKGIEPTSAITGRFCVLQMDAPNNAIVPAMVSGVTPCKVKIESLTDEFCEIETSTSVDRTKYLKSGGSGSAQIMFVPTALGEQWGVVRLGNRATAKNPQLAYFYPHSDPTVAYPAKTSLCRKFPAYLQRAITYNDDPTSGGYSCVQSLTVPVSTEKIIVYNIRNWWVPENFLYWVWEYNGKWYTDYVKPAGPLSYYGTISSMGTGSHDLNATDVDYGFDGQAVTVASDGTITAHRNLYAMVTVSVLLELIGAGPSEAFITYSGTATPATSFSQASVSFQNLSYSGSRASLSTQATFSMGAGTTLKFILSVNAGGSDVINDVTHVITVDTQCSQ